MNNSREMTPTQAERRSSERIKRLKRTVGVLAVAGLAVGSVELAGANDGASFHGEQTIRIDGNYPTVTDIANEVDGAGNGHARETIDQIVELNSDVFQDRGPGKSRAFVESQDVGKEITVPVSVE